VADRPAPRPSGRVFITLIVVCAGALAGMLIMALARDSGRNGSVGDPGPPPLLCQLVAECRAPVKNGAKVDCSFSVTDGVGVLLYANRAGMEYRGRSSLQYPKKNYAVELRDAAGTKMPTSFLGMGKDEDWILDGSWADRSFMRNPLVLDSYASLGTSRYGAQSRFCTFSLNGANQGIYRLGEKIKRSVDRLAIAADDGAGSSFIIKQDDKDNLGILSASLGGRKTWEMIYPKQDTATPAQRAGVQAWLDKFTAALNGADPGNANSGVFTFLDLDTTVDWILIQEFSKNIDAYNLSLHLARTAGHTAWLVPWDFDLAFGQPTVSGGQNTNDKPTGWVFNRTPFIVHLSQASQLTTRLPSRWQALRQGGLSDAAIAQRLANYQTTLTPAAVAENFAIWPLEAVNFSQIYKPYTLYRVISYGDELATLSSWIKARLAWMDAHVATYPQ
jgi:hypothetical protein